MFKVMHSDGHNSPTVHVFRDEDQFIEYIKGCIHEDDLDYQLETWEDDRTLTDGNGDTWEEYSGLYEVDHTKE